MLSTKNQVPSMFEQLLHSESGNPVRPVMVEDIQESYDYSKNKFDCDQADIEMVESKLPDIQDSECSTGSGEVSFGKGPQLRKRCKVAKWLMNCPQLNNYAADEEDECWTSYNICISEINAEAGKGPYDDDHHSESIKSNDEMGSFTSESTLIDAQNLFMKNPDAQWMAELSPIDKKEYDSDGVEFGYWFSPERGYYQIKTQEQWDDWVCYNEGYRYARQSE